MKISFIKKYGTLLLLAAGAGIIFNLPYIRETFYVPIQNAMNLSNSQMGLLSSGYAATATLSYFIGGIIADKFSARKLLTFSFLATGGLGLWFSTFPGFTISRTIFVLMGISTIITFWSWHPPRSCRNARLLQSEGIWENAVRPPGNLPLNIS